MFASQKAGAAFTVSPRAMHFHAILRAVDVLTQITIFPMFGLVVSVADNLVIGRIFTAVSILS